MTNNSETVTQYNFDEVIYWSNTTPASIMLTNTVNPDALVWHNDEFLGTLKEATENDGIVRCDGCKRYFFSFDIYASGEDEEFCYEFCSDRQPPE
jgi:hypothetical protein